MTTQRELSVKVRKRYDSTVLAEALKRLGVLTAEQLESVLAQIETERRSIGRLLIEKGILSEAMLMDVVSNHLGIARIAPTPTLIDYTLLQRVSEGFLRKHTIVPAFKRGDVLTLIMADPFDERVLRELERLFACEIEPAIAALDEILNAITQCFLTVRMKLDVSREAKKDLVIGQTFLSAAKEESVTDLVDFIISNAVAEGASDIHIEPQEAHVRVRYRIDGVLVHQCDLALALASSITSRVKVLCGLDITERRRHQDGRIESRVMGKDVDLRVSSYATVHGESVVIRILPRQTSLIELDALGFAPFNRKKYQELLDYPSGVILVTGPTGSGKSTTLYASLHHLNRLDRKIITVEDPVEYYIPGVVQGQLDAKLELTYQDFLKSMMRQDPDVLMIGEVRNTEGAKAVIQAALTGHKVFSTFHTEDTTGALLRLMNMGIETFLISSTLVSVVAQRLVRVLCPACRQPSRPTPALLNAFHVTDQGIEDWTFYEAVGCTQCKGTGFKGRTAIHELLVVNDAVRDAILARKPSSQIRLLAREQARLVSMREDGLYKATQGLISLEEILRVVFHNESDALLPRSIAEVVALCEGREPIAVRQIGDGGENRELYRTRFACDSISTAHGQITELFHVCGKAMMARSQPFDQRRLNDFTTFVINSVRRLHLTQTAAFVDLVLTEVGNKVKIAAIPIPLNDEPPSLSVN